MSDINELIKSGAVPSATPRTSKIFIPEVIVTEPVTSSVSAEMEPKKEEGQPESKIQEVEEDHSPTKKDEEVEAEAEVHHARTDSETVSESDKPVDHDGESLRGEVESLPEVKEEEEERGERQSLKSQTSKPETVHDEEDGPETAQVERHDEEGAGEVVSIRSLENGDTKSEGKHSEVSDGDRASLYLDEEVTSSENGSVQKLHQQEQEQLEPEQEEPEQEEPEQQQHEDVESDEEHHPSVAELLAAAKSSRESGAGGPQIIIPKPVGVKSSEAKVESETTEVEIVEDKVEVVHVDEKVETSSSNVGEEKGKSNEEVLSKLVDEAENDEDRSHVTNLLKWAKGTRKSKTETMKVREKKREDSFKRAVDVDAVPIIIEYKNKDEKIVQSSQRTFKVTPNDSLTQNGASGTKIENIVTKSWIQSAIRAHEDVTDDVTVVTLNIGRHDSGNHSAKIVAKLGDGSDGNRSYDWIIKKALPKTATQDKETFITVDLGTKLARFAKKGTAKSAKKVEVVGSNTFPLNSLIYSDNSHAVYEDLGGFRAINSEEGLSLDCLKWALKALARVHATSFAYFAKSGDDSAKKLLIDPSYQLLSSNGQEKVEAKEKLNRSFENLLELLRGLGTDGVILADKAKARFGNRLFDIFKDALQASSNFSVLCHGFPVQADFLFGFDADGQKPVDVRIVNLKQARLAHAVTDVLPLMFTAMGPKVEEQAGFLLRFVYFETLASNLKSFGLENQIDFDSLKKDFKSKETYGALAGAMYLAEIGGKTPIRARGSGTRVSGKRGFTSKLLGSYSGGKEESVEKQEEVLGSTPATRAKALIEKIVSEF